MRTLKLSKTLLQEYLNSEVIGIYCKTIELNPNRLHITELILDKPYMLLYKNDELFCLTFSANTTTKNNLNFMIRKVKGENINDCNNVLKIEGELNHIRTYLHNTQQQLIFETSTVNFVISVDCRYSKEKIIFYYQQKY